MCPVEDYVDHALELPDTADEDHFNTLHARRLDRLQQQAVALAAMPRRLGRDATPAELAADKRASRSVRHWAGVLADGWRSVRGAGGLFNYEIRNALWQTEAGEALAGMPKWRTEIATYATRNAVARNWANNRLHLLQQEAEYWCRVLDIVGVDYE